MSSNEKIQTLKRKYLFVFPELPICSFVEREAVAHLFTEQWHSNYFLTARIDFVVCDKAGIPEFALEYQGGYHKNKAQREKDDFKRTMMNCAGLHVRWVDYKTLKEIESGKEDV